MAGITRGKDKVFMYELNEILVYGNNGVCKLVDIRKERFSGAPTMYYILAPVFDSRSKVYVPVNNEKLASRLRPVMLKEKLHEMMLEAKSSEITWESDDRKRGQEFHDIVSGGLSLELLTVMKTLVIHRQELSRSVRRLHSADEKTLALCEKIVGEEFAYAFGVDVDDALSHIEGEFTAA